MAKITAVLFDLDDTLFDRRGSQRRIARLLIDEFPRTFAGLDETTVIDAFLESDREATCEFVAGGPAETVRTGRSRRFLASLGLDEGVAQDLTAAYLRAYGTVGAPVEGAVCLVRRLSQEFPLGIVSNGFPDVQYTKLRTLGPVRQFGCVLLSEEIGIRKPDTAIFRRAATALDCEARACLFVGDSYETDVVGAKLAGMTACWYNPRRVPLPQSPVHPNLTIQALEQLPGILALTVTSVPANVRDEGVLAMDGES